MVEQYQTVTLVLTNGVRATYTGRAQITDDSPVRVVDVVVSTPKDLPAAMRFGRLETCEGGTLGNHTEVTDFVAV